MLASVLPERCIWCVRMYLSYGAHWIGQMQRAVRNRLVGTRVSATVGTAPMKVLPGTARYSQVAKESNLLWRRVR